MALPSLPIDGIAATAPLIGTVVLGEKMAGRGASDRVVGHHRRGDRHCLAHYLLPDCAGQAQRCNHVVVANACVLLPSVLWFAQRDGAKGAAFTVLVTAAIILAGVLRHCQPVYIRLVDVGYSRAAAASRVLMYFVVRVLHTTGHDALDLALSVCVGSVVFGVALMSLWAVMPKSATSGEAFILERVRERLPSRRTLVEKLRFFDRLLPARDVPAFSMAASH